MEVFLGLTAFLFFAISLFLIFGIFWMWGHTREELNSKLELGYDVTFKAKIFSRHFSNCLRRLHILSNAIMI